MVRLELLADDPVAPVATAAQEDLVVLSADAQLEPLLPRVPREDDGARARLEGDLPDHRSFNRAAA